MNYEPPFYPHFSPRFYSSYSQSRSRFVNRDIYYQNSPGMQNRDTNKNGDKSSDKKYNERALNNSKPSTNDNFSNTERDSDIMFEIFGIKLHSDDVLLICLIFFLYNEGVKDEFLFIALILLLLS